MFSYITLSYFVYKLITERFVVLQGGLCNVYIDEIGRTVSVPGNNLEPVLPGKNDKVVHSFTLR